MRALIANTRAGEVLISAPSWTVYREEEAPMERRRLGRTGHLSSVVIFGAAAIG
jgi:hypothetical protein